MQKDEAQDYYTQQAKNEFAFREMLKTIKPELYVLFDVLEQTGVNWFILVKVARALHLIATGNGYGSVTINVENGKVIFIRGEEADRVNEPILLKMNNAVDKHE